MTDAQYNESKQFFITFVEWFVPISQKSQKAEDQPDQFLAWLENKAPAQAKKGLQMAINDMVELSSSWTPQQVASADSRLATENVITLTEMRRRYSKTYSRLLKIGLIKNVRDYYLIKGIREAGGLKAEEDETKKLDQMLAEFESKVSDAKKS